MAEEREARAEERRQRAQARQVHIAQARERVRKTEAARVDGMLRKEAHAETRLEQRRRRDAAQLERQRAAEKQQEAQRGAAVERAKAAAEERVRALVMARKHREEALWHNMEVQAHVKKQQHVQSKLRQSDARERVTKAKLEAAQAKAKLETNLQRKAERVGALEKQKFEAYEELQLTKKKMRAEQDEFKREMQRTLDAELRRAKYASCHEEELGGEGVGGGGEWKRQGVNTGGRPGTAGAGRSGSAAESRRRRPASAPQRQSKKTPPGGITLLPDPMEMSLRQVIEEERAKEAERAGVLSKVHDPKERQRLHKLFNIEREHAKEIIIRLSAQLSGAVPATRGETFDM